MKYAMNDYLFIDQVVDTEIWTKHSGLFDYSMRTSFRRMFRTNQREICWIRNLSVTRCKLRIFLTIRRPTNKYQQIQPFIKRYRFNRLRNSRSSILGISSRIPDFRIEGKACQLVKYTRAIFPVQYIRNLHTLSILGSGFQGRSNGAITITSHSEIHSLVG